MIFVDIFVLHTKIAFREDAEASGRHSHAKQRGNEVQGARQRRAPVSYEEKRLTK